MTGWFLNQAGRRLAAEPTMTSGFLRETGRENPRGHSMTSRFLHRDDSGTGERGSMAIEIVSLTPVLIAFTLLVVAGGRLVGRQGDVDSLARDAARAASIERNPDTAVAVAQTVAAASSPAGAACEPAVVDTSNWTQGGSVRVTIRCQVSYSGLGLIGLPGSTRVEGSSDAPLDQFRRTE